MIEKLFFLFNHLQHFIKKLQISPDDKAKIFINIEVCIHLPAYIFTFDRLF